MNEKMKLAIIDQIISDFFEFGDEKDSSERKLGKAEGAMNAIYSVINTEIKDKNAPAIDQIDELIDVETGERIL